VRDVCAFAPLERFFRPRLSPLWSCWFLVSIGGHKVVRVFFASTTVVFFSLTLVASAFCFYRVCNRSKATNLPQLLIDARALKNTTLPQRLSPGMPKRALTMLGCSGIRSSPRPVVECCCCCCCCCGGDGGGDGGGGGGGQASFGRMKRKGISTSCTAGGERARYLQRCVPL